MKALHRSAPFGYPALGAMGAMGATTERESKIGAHEESLPEERFGRFGLGTVRVYWKRLRQKTGGTRSECIAGLAARESQSLYDALGARSRSLDEAVAGLSGVEDRARLFERAFLALDSPIAALDGRTGGRLWANRAFEELVGPDGPALESAPPHEDGRTARLRDERSGATLAVVGDSASVFVVWAEP